MGEWYREWKGMLKYNTLSHCQTLFPPQLFALLTVLWPLNAPKSPSPTSLHRPLFTSPKWRVSGSHGDEYWDVTQCPKVDRNQRFGEKHYLILQGRKNLVRWRWRQQVPPKRYYLPHPRNRTRRLILGVLGSDVGRDIDYAEWVFPWFTSVSPCKCWGWVTLFHTFRTLSS
jgi:hypothetical protein